MHDRLCLSVNRAVILQTVDRSPGKSLVKYAGEQQSATYKQIRSKAISDMQQRLNAGVLDDRGKRTLRAFQGQASLDAQIYELNVR